MSKRSDEVYVRHMMQMCRIAGSVVEGATRTDLDTDVKLQLALVRAVSTVGEAARHLSASFREAHNEIDWAAIIAMRHKLVHGYFDIDLDVVWETATREVPARPATRPLAIDVPHEEIAEFCRKWGIRRLAFFGGPSPP